MKVDLACWSLRRMTHRSLSLGLLVMLALLPGCNDEKTRSLIDQRAAEAQKATADMNQYAPVKHYNPLVVTDKVWAGNSALRMHRGMPLPAKFETEHGITLVSSEPMTLQEIVSALTVQTGIPIHLADGASASGGATRGGPPGGLGAGSGGGGAGASGSAMQVAYEGPLSGLLEKAAGYFGVNWRFDGATIAINRFETRVFVIEALPGTQSVSEGMQDDTSGSSGGSGGSSGGSSGGGSSSTSSITQNSKFQLDFKYWDELDQILTAMLGGTGTVVSSPSIGTVTISTTPEVMRSIADYISKENERLSRQIAVSVEIYSVNLTESTDFSIAFTEALKRLTNFGITYSGGSAPPAIAGAVTGGGTLSVAILNPNQITRRDGSILHPIGSVGDVFTALSGIGDTTKVAKFPLVTLNNRPVSRRIGEDVGYVASSTTANTTTGSTSNIGTTLNPATIHQGFSVQLTPRLLDDGRILLQYSLSVIDIVSITPFNSETGSATAGSAGSSTIEIPTTDNRIFVQQSILKSGSMLFLGGAEEEDLSHNSQGVGDPFNYFLGGGTTSARTHTMLFMAITPQVLDEPHSEQD